MTDTVRVLVVPGWHGSEPGHWQSIWERKYPGFIRVDQHDWQFPDRNRWVDQIDRHVPENQPTVVVAHSLGAVATVHWEMERNRPALVRGALLVAPPWFADKESAPEAIRAFFPLPLARLRFPSILVASENDPYLPFPIAERLSRTWGSRLVNAGPVGHINVESGHGEWSQGEELLCELLGLKIGERVVR